MKPTNPWPSRPPERPFWIEKWMDRTGYPEDYRQEFWEEYDWRLKNREADEANKWARRELFFECLPKLTKQTAGGLSTIATIVILILKWHG